jgi:hypothetical protein
MKIGLFGISGIAPGKHNLKDPRLDQADQLVEAQKKTCAQVEVVEEKELLTCDAILTSHAALSDLLMKDLDFVETRLGRDAGAAEKAVLQKLAEALVSEQPVSAAGLTADELAAISAHNFYSNKPVVAATAAELAAPDALLVRAFAESGYITFLTVAAPRRPDGVGRGGYHPHGYPTWFHPRRDHQLCGFGGGGRRDAGQARGQTAVGAQNVRDAGLRRGELPV